MADLFLGPPSRPTLEGKGKGKGLSAPLNCKAHAHVHTQWNTVLREKQQQQKSC